MIDAETTLRNAVDDAATELATLTGIQIQDTERNAIIDAGLHGLCLALLYAIANLSGAEHESAYYGGAA